MKQCRSVAGRRRFEHIGDVKISLFPREVGRCFAITSHGCPTHATNEHEYEIWKLSLKDTDSATLAVEFQGVIDRCGEGTVIGTEGGNGEECQAGIRR